MKLNLTHRFTEELPADPITENYRRQVSQACFSYVNPTPTAKPLIIHSSKAMAVSLGLSEDDIQSDHFRNVMTGNTIQPNTTPYAMCYGGHQFGHWAGQLGDGRAINLFEVTHNNQNWTVQLKGAGATPYSRRGDGLAVLRSSVREYLCSEAMFHLGIPTTRALSLALTGDDVLRDIMYNGNAAYEKGAIVSRVAPSFLRFGSYEIFASRGDVDTLKTLVNYTIKYHFLELGAPSKESYIELFRTVTQRTLDLIIHWQRVGFVHGVMNTDNMSILGLTIDYGPYGWLEGFDFGWTPNTSDTEHKRYRYGNQPNVALWNLVQLANAFYPLIEDTAPFETILQQYKTDFEVQSLAMMRSKLGLMTAHADDLSLVQTLEDNLHAIETDMTIFFRTLSSFKKDGSIDGLELVHQAIYNPEKLTKELQLQWKEWFTSYAKRLAIETVSDKDRAKAMNAVNPKYVLRNYMAQLAIDDADKGNYDLIDELFQLLKNPYDEQPNSKKWFAKRPEWARHKVGCSMLSCSS